jgi:ribosomal protein S24E
MSVKIIEHKKNPLMNREEVRAVFEHLGRPTPRREDILPDLEKVLKVESSLILINKIFTQKGRGESNLKVFVYEKKEDMPRRNLEVIQKRAEKKKSAKAEAPAEAPKKEEHKKEAAEKKHEEAKEHKAEHKGEHKEEAHEKHHETHKEHEGAKHEGHAEHKEAEHEGHKEHEHHEAHKKEHEKKE